MKRKRMVSVVLVSAAVVAVLAAIPASAGTARSFFSTAVKRPIPDAPEGGGVLSKLQIRSGGRIADIEVGIRINHTATTDLNIYLVSPQGKFVELSTDNGGGGNNYGTGSNSCGGGGSFTVFNDEANRSIRSGNAPFAGSWRPQTPW